MNTYLLIGIIYLIIGVVISYTYLVVDITKAKINKSTFDSRDLVGDLSLILFWLIWIVLEWGDNSHAILNFRDKK